MLTATLTLVFIALFMGGFLYFKDKSLLFKGLDVSFQNVKSQLPLLLLAFVLVGFLEVLLPVDLVQEYLGEGSGITGILLAALMGAALPAGPYVVFPIASAMAVAGAGTPFLVAFITGWMMLSASALPFELSLMGPRFTLIRVPIFMVFPLLAGLITYWFF